jgi:lysylphosphatidylglycerol synthetase-like protein (DUF2156 family)
MTSGRERIRVAAVVVGSLLAAAALASIADLVWVLTRPPAPHQLVDTYYVLPNPWITVAVFAAGIVGDVMFRARAGEFGPRAVAIWRTHLLFTTALLVVWLIAGAQAGMTQAVVLVVYAACPLMLFAHGAALAGAGLVLRRTGHPAADSARQLR